MKQRFRHPFATIWWMTLIVLFLKAGLCRAADLPGLRPASALPAETAKVNSVVQIMKRSIRNKEIKEFTSNQVIRWKSGRQETLNGIRYRTGMVSFRAETIFGVKNLQAKAYIRNNRVFKWVWPKSGLQIV